MHMSIMEHARTDNSWFTNPFIEHNKSLHDTLIEFDKEQLEEYYSDQDYFESTSMIGFNALGRMGRLANQMFQYASLKGIAKNHGYDYMIAYHPMPSMMVLGICLGTELFDSFDLKVRTGLFNAPTLSERVHNFDQQFFDELS